MQIYLSRFFLSQMHKKEQKTVHFHSFLTYFFFFQGRTEALWICDHHLLYKSLKWYDSGHASLIHGRFKFYLFRREKNEHSLYSAQAAEFFFFFLFEAMSGSLVWQGETYTRFYCITLLLAIFSYLYFIKLVLCLCWWMKLIPRLCLLYAEADTQGVL